MKDTDRIASLLKIEKSAILSGDWILADMAKNERVMILNKY